MKRCRCGVIYLGNDVYRIAEFVWGADVGLRLALVSTYKSRHQLEVSEVINDKTRAAAGCHIRQESSLPE